MKLEIGKHFCKINGDSKENYDVEIVLRGRGVPNLLKMTIDAIGSMRNFGIYERKISNLMFRSEPDETGVKETIEQYIRTYNRSVDFEK